MSSKELAPFYAKIKGEREVTENVEIEEQEGLAEQDTSMNSSLFEGDATDEEEEHEEQARLEKQKRLAQERKQAAWWGSKPNAQADTQTSTNSRTPSKAKNPFNDSSVSAAQEAAFVLERLMRQTAFNEGDQELLASAFEAIDEDGSGRIDYDEFWEALAPITHNLREQDRQELFMKVDQDCSGAVDLFDFLNFFLVTTYDQLQRPATRSGSAGRLQTSANSRKLNQPTPSFFPTAKPAKPLNAGHKDIIIGIFQNKAADQYATVSRDGVLSTWSKDLKYQRSFKVADPRMSLGGNRHTSAGFIQATCMTPNTGLIAVASMKRIIRFYDFNTSDRNKNEETNTTTPTFQFKPSTRPTMCLNCVAMPDGREFLMRGGDEGTVDCQFLKPGWHRVEGAALGTFNQQKFREEFSEKFQYKTHDSWVTKVNYVDDINSVVSTGHDNVLAMMDLETMKVKWRLDSSRVRFSSLSERAHTRGIRTWDFSRQFSVFCTGGVERTVQLWSPFVNRPVGSLRGSNSSAIDIKINDGDFQIITLGADKTIKVWDIRNQKCVATITDSTNQLPENSFSAMLYDRHNEQLLTGSGRPQMYNLKRAVSVRETYYNFVAITTCSSKNLVAVADESNEIRMFRAGSGRGVSTFCGCPPDNGAVTALAFDSDEIRLLVAANDGFIRLFNHGNGMLLKQFALVSKPDIASMLATSEHSERLLYAATDAKELYAWKDTDDAISERPIAHTHLDVSAHEADVSDVCAVPPETIVTCSFDGKVVIWGGGIMVRSMQDPENANKPIMERGMLKLCLITIKPTGVAVFQTPDRGAPPSRSAPSPPIRIMRTTSRDPGARRGSISISPGSNTNKNALPAIRGAQGSPGRTGSANYDPSPKLLHVVASAGSDGHVHFWDVMPAGGHLFKYCVFKPAKSGFGVVQMCTDDTKSFLFCGDAHGIVKVLDISQLQNELRLDSIIPLYDFRAHDRSLIGMDFIQSSGQGLDGSGALMTATKEEVRLWTIEGQHIGQFGRDNWDLSQGYKMPLRRDDIHDIGDDIVEDEGGSNARLSELWLSPDKIVASEEIPENLSASWESSMSDGAESPDEAHNYFDTTDSLTSVVAAGKAAKAKVQAMPRAWQKSKRLDINMFGRIPLTDLADTQWAKGKRGERSVESSPGLQPPSGAASPAPRPSKHRVRMAAALQELRHTPIEMRPGLLSAGDSALKPSTPEIYGLSRRPKVELPDRSHTSMM